MISGLLTVLLLITHAGILAIVSRSRRDAKKRAAIQLSESPSWQNERTRGAGLMVSTCTAAHLAGLPPDEAIERNGRTKPNQKEQ